MEGMPYKKNHWWNILMVFSIFTNSSTINTKHTQTDDVFTIFGLLYVFASSVCHQFHHAILCCQNDVFPHSFHFCFCIMSQMCCQNNEDVSLICQGFVILRVALGKVVKVRSRGCVVMLSTAGREISKSPEDFSNQIYCRWASLLLIKTNFKSFFFIFYLLIT